MATRDSLRDSKSRWLHKRARRAVQAVVDYFDRHGQARFRPGEGRITGYIGATLGIASLMAVICFHFPQWLTLPELRSFYGEEFARTALRVALVIALGLGTINLLRNRRKRLAATGLGAAVIAAALGGATIPVGAIEQTPISLGLDWFILALIASAVVFIPLEKAYARRRDQKILRPKWRTDLTYFFVSHMLVQLVLIAAMSAATLLTGWTLYEPLQANIQSLVWPVQLLLAVVFADLAQYAVHRAYHSVFWLWRFHSIHHSSESMDWLAASRIHLVETMLTRSAVLVPLLLFGFSAQALNAYIILIGVQAVVSHANLRIDGGWLRYVVVLPRYHHWHHSADPEFADKNFAIHLPVIDMIFGTFKLPPKRWPQEYGVFGEGPPEDFVGQQLYPFRGEKTH